MKIQNKALYGLLRSALLFYKKLVGDLEGNGFVLNPYDPCVANKVINGAQMTVCLHVDNLKVSHVDLSEVTKFGQWLNKTYRIAVAEHLGKVHDYLGMILDFTMDGCVIVNMAGQSTSKRSSRISQRTLWTPRRRPRQNTSFK